MIMDQSFPKKIRLNHSKIIREVFSKGLYKSFGVIQVKYISAKGDSSRFSISVKRNVGNAPRRNHIRRLLKEVIRQKRSMLNSPHDFCFFITRSPDKPLNYSYVLKNIKEFFNSLDKGSCD